MIQQAQSVSDVEAWRINIRVQTFANYHYQMGLALERTGDLPSAHASYRAALTVDPRHAAAAMRLIAALDRSGQQAEAAELHARSLALNPAYEVEGTLMQVLDLLNAGKTEEALTLFSGRMPLPQPLTARSIQVLGDIGNTFYSLSSTALQEILAPKVLSAAADAFRIAVTSAPTSELETEAVLQYVRSLVRMGDQAGVLAILDPFLQAPNGLPDALVAEAFIWRGLARLALDRQPDGDLDRAVGLDGGNWFTHYAQALERFVSGAYAACRESLAKAQGLNSRIPHIVALGAHLAVIEGAVSDAIAALETFRKELPYEEPTVLSTLAGLYMTQAEAEKAREPIGQALSLAGKDPWVLLHSLLVYDALGDAERVAAVTGSLRSLPAHTVRFQARFFPWGSEVLRRHLLSCTP
ncbi:hypothetical protein [Azospirillum melinis]